MREVKFWWLKKQSVEIYVRTNTNSHFLVLTISEQQSNKYQVSMAMFIFWIIILQLNKWWKKIFLIYELIHHNHQPMKSQCLRFHFSFSFKLTKNSTLLKEVLNKLMSQARVETTRVTVSDKASKKAGSSLSHWLALVQGGHCVSWQ